jgi:hypothetical protein
MDTAVVAPGETDLKKVLDGHLTKIKFYAKMLAKTVADDQTGDAEAFTSVNAKLEAVNVKLSFRLAKI